MSHELVSAKYASIGATYGPEAAEFAMKIIGIYAKGRGVEGLIWNEVLGLYTQGEIVVYEDAAQVEDLKGKILLRHAVMQEEDYKVNAAFGFLDTNKTPVFAEQPHSLYEWDGSVSSLTTAILDIGKDFHGRMVSDPVKLSTANNIPLMVRALNITNRLSTYIRDRENPAIRNAMLRWAAN